MRADNATTQPERADVNAEKVSDLAISSQASETGKVQRSSRKGVGASAPKRAATLAERFYAKVRVGEDCHEWTGCTMRNGYGQISVNCRAAYAHRVAWELNAGPIPDGLFVLHRCDNRKCVNPDHLFLGTFGDNMADMVSKERQAHGMRNGHAKLTDDQVREIRGAAGTHLAIAKRYDVTQSLVTMIRTRRIWRYVDDMTSSAGKPAAAQQAGVA